MGGAGCAGASGGPASGCGGGFFFGGGSPYSLRIFVASASIIICSWYCGICGSCITTRTGESASRPRTISNDPGVVLLPDSVDRENFDPDSREIPRERWHYRRGPKQDQDLVVVLVNDQVVEVTEPKIK